MTLKRPLSSWRPILSGTLTPFPSLQMAIPRMADSPTSPSLVAMDSPTQPSGLRSLTMVALLAIQQRMALTTSPMSARSMQPPGIQLTLQSLYPIGSTRPFKGWPLAMLPSLMQSRTQMTGVLKPMLCSIEISMSASSTTKPNSIALTVSSRVLSLPEINAGVGLNACKLRSGFCIWQENSCGCPPTSTLEGDGRKDEGVTSKRECDVIDLTNEGSSSNDKEQ